MLTKIRRAFMILSILALAVKANAQNDFNFTEKNLFGLSFEADFEEFKSENVALSYSVDLKSDDKVTAIFVVTISRDGKNILWMSYPLSEGYQKSNEWWTNNNILKIPNDYVKGGKLKCYVWNKNKETFFAKNFNATVEPIERQSYMPVLPDSKLPTIMKAVDKSPRCDLALFYDKKSGKIALADDSLRLATSPISVYYSYIIENDTVESQNDVWRKRGGDKSVTFESKSDVTTAQLHFNEKQENICSFDLETKFHSDVKLLRASLVIPFRKDDLIVYRRTSLIDTAAFQNEYYLDKEGFSVIFNNKILTVYHQEKLSSIQLDTKTATALLNIDYHNDHPFVHYPLDNDTADFFQDVSARIVKKGETIKGSTLIQYSNNESLPRFMPIHSGYESAFIFTEHADWTDIKTHRAVCFGNEDVTQADSAVGGFVRYGIPVTKSVFYNNPDSVKNFEKNAEYPGLHSTIKTDTAFFDFLKQLKNKGFDICLHTPEQYSSNKANLAEAFGFMKENFNSISWIDHGYNNSQIHNRENLVCDGLDENTPYYIYDLFRKNGVRYPWNAAYEELKPFNDWTFDCNLERPYPGFGDAFPLPKTISLPNYPKMTLWSTTYTLEPCESWGYYLNNERLNNIVKFRDVFIAHIYPAWVTTERGFWDMENGKAVAKEGFNQALQRIAELKEKRLMLPTTIADWMHYREQLSHIDYQINKDGTVILVNNNDDVVKGLSLVSLKAMKCGVENPRNEIVDKDFESRRSGDEYIIWFDMNPKEKVIIY